MPIMKEKRLNNHGVFKASLKCYNKNKKYKENTLASNITSSISR